MDDVIRAEGLRKRFGDTKALDGVDITARRGTVLGVLGPNGAGKTTAVRVLATLLKPDAGRAEVSGYDVLKEPARVRAKIGLTGQYASVDEELTGTENLVMIARLLDFGRRESKARARQLLDRFHLTDAAGRAVKTYSGGMRRRLDLAATLVAAPPVLFLDEPTTGLDPQSRNELWALVRELVRDGATLLLTTQYLEEADRLADDIVVLRDGRIAACGSPSALKARIGGERIDVTVAAHDALEAGAAALAPFADGEPASDRDALVVTAPMRPGTPLLEVVRALDAAGVAATDVHRREPTLDDVFLTLTTAGAEMPEEIAA
jgi:oleandomycin transport system ATP-binding protein